jgi:hypothetical protein
MVKASEVRLRNSLRLTLFIADDIEVLTGEEEPLRRALKSIGANV